MHTSILLLAAFTASTAQALFPPEVTEYFFETKLDHFNTYEEQKTFPMRYLVKAEYWDFKDGPILFYTGNEGTIWSFYNNTGFWTETLAKELNALVVFGEHRYFGESFPTQFDKKDAFKGDNIDFFTVDQTMMDYVELVKHIKYTYAATNSPVIAFGGSYGGMLTAWIRMKYPSVFAGGVAASAPILYFEGVTTPEAFFTQTTNTFAETTVPTKNHCNKIIREAWDHLMVAKSNLAAQSTDLNSILNLCSPGPAVPADISDVYDHFSSGL